MPTDAEAARRLVALHGDDIRYCHHTRRWLVWDGRRYAPDPAGQALCLAAEAAADLHPDPPPEPQDRRHAEARAIASGRVVRLRAMLALARGMAPIPVAADQLDADPWLLNCANGTLDLRTLALRQHRRQDLLTRLAPVEYRPGAHCPAWEEYLQRVVPDEGVRGCLQRAAGYSLTGDTSLRLMFTLEGTGRNGKSLFLQTLRSLLGDYAACVAAGAILAGHGAGVTRDDLLRLRGVRLAVASETGEDAVLAEDLVKDLTGGDRLAARSLQGDWVEFRPVCKLWLAVNRRPRVSGLTDSIWDRVCLFPFSVRIPEEDVLPRWQFEERFAREQPGILNWLLAGLQAYLEEGLALQASLRQLTAGYRAEMDGVGTFVADRCDVGRGKRGRFSVLYREYVAWCEKGGVAPVTIIEFGRQLCARGFERLRSNGVVYRKGIQLHVDVLDMA